MFIGDWHWQEYDIVTSTNDISMELSSNPPASKYLITAKEQTAGRGRRGRSWQSLKGNLFASFTLQGNSNLLNILPFIFSLSLFDSIKDYAHQADIDIKLKWPNDVLINGCKVSGILLEKADNNYIICGIGVNLALSPQDIKTLYPTISLTECGINVKTHIFLETYVKHLDDYLAKCLTYGSNEILKCWLDNAHQIGEKITVRMENTFKEGLFAGLDTDGALLLSENGKIVRIYAGDVFIDGKNK